MVDGVLCLLCKPIRAEITAIIEIDHNEWVDLDEDDSKAGYFRSVLGILMCLVERTQRQRIDRRLELAGRRIDEIFPCLVTTIFNPSADPQGSVGQFRTKALGERSVTHRHSPVRSRPDFERGTIG